MLNTQCIGVGAAGNKGLIEVVRNNVIEPGDALIVNSTLQDIAQKDISMFPAENVIQLRDPNEDPLRQQQGGCGKEPKVGEQLARAAIDNKVLNLGSFIKPDTQQVIIIGSLGGGTGCGASVVIAEEIKDVYSTPDHPISVVIIGFSGFENDEREMINAISFFKRLSDDFVIDIICNRKYLAGGNNQLKACELANQELANKISVLAGNMIQPSEHNIDPRDLLKTVSRFGYILAECQEINEKIKNVEHFNQILQNMIDESGSMDTEKAGEVVISVIINLPASQQEYIDHSFSVLKNAYGNAFELFEHIQSVDSMKPFISFIVSGMQMPIEEVNGIYERYMEQKSKNVAPKKDFFTSMDNLKIDEHTGFEFGSQRAASRRNRRQTQQPVRSERPHQSSHKTNENEINPGENY